MEDDIEKSTFGKDAKLDKIELEVNELSEKVEKLDISGLKDQITGLSDSLRELQETELLARRHIAFVDIEYLRSNLLRWLDGAVGGREINEALYSEAVDYVQRVSSAAQQEVLNSPLPISVAQNFRAKCQKYFDDKGTQAFFKS